MKSNDNHTFIALIGLGSIGISFAALYLKHSTSTIVSVYDPRPDLDEHIRSVLPVYLGDSTDPELSVDRLIKTKRLRIYKTLKDACKDANIVQEQGPENLAFKTSIWKEVTNYVGSETQLWSSTSGIPASKQSAGLDDSVKSRLLVIHPFNPPHIMPLIEIVPSPTTAEYRVGFAQDWFHGLRSGHRPVVLKKEVPGFVGNRLAFVLLREACHLVSEGVVSVKDLDTIVESSLGPRWAVTGPFKSYHYGGGTKGLSAFFQNLAGTIENVWDDAGKISFRENPFLSVADDGRNDGFVTATAAADGDGSTGEGHEMGQSWASKVVAQTEEAYGLPTPADFATRDEALNKLLRARST